MPCASAQPDPSDRYSRDAAVLEHLDQVRAVAKNMHRRLPRGVVLDDLISAGTIGLIKAVDRFDESRGVTLSTYAQHRITGAMIDFLRGEDPLSRSDRRRMREATAEEPSCSRSAAPVTLSLDRIPERTLKGTCETTGHSPLISVMRSELNEARRCLSPAENCVLSLLYDLGFQSKEAARDLGVAEHRVWQIKRRALAKLRTHFRQ